MSTYVTIRQVAEHARKHEKTVRRSMRAAGIIKKPEPGVHGHRVELQVANNFIAKHWPKVRPIKREDLYETSETKPNP